MAAFNWAVTKVVIKSVDQSNSTGIDLVVEMTFNDLIWKKRSATTIDFLILQILSCVIGFGYVANQNVTVSLLFESMHELKT